MDLKGKSVFVGLSGGVDSAVSAALLKEAGANVTGVFIKGWYPPGMPCSWAEERREAMRVAAHLRIPFRTLDANVAYKKGVIDYLLAEYRAGRTPNPDVMCNRDVKFGAFYEYAMREGADHIATGHYRSGEKDQTYFLWAVPADVIAKTIFPVGELEKPAVRKLAQKFGLPNAAKKDSQGICFLGSVSVEEFLQNEFKTVPGQALDESGTLIGMHAGALLYTLGERAPLPSGPWYVLAKDLAKNELIVGRERSQSGHIASTLRFVNANWWGNPKEATEAQYRYRGPKIEGHIEGEAFVPAAPLPEAVAAGQSIVFWNGSVCVGGGTLAS